VKAQASALKNEKIWAAGLDVYEKEPAVDYDI
jgi:lactate dehydrogenase-like 2-hydroxyacid dehydrogenase